ncbi:response regulator transcription factor [Armatimonas sp.]|uniref:response regulator transcription factor n=1 Tax=Armatimonas sp. TaxID=1872638 RepID=UPI00286C1A65|nr:response regulator transcription factor [Armatimonas sp.]
MSGKLLLVDDDRYVLNPLARLLGINGYHCTLAVTGHEALRLLATEEFDLMLLDIGLPDMDGLTVCRRARAKHNLPILMLTARDASSEKILGLEVGADDYITKPFEPQEILARIRAQLRRFQEYGQPLEAENKVVLGSLIVDLDLRDALVEGRRAQLTAREFELLVLLARSPGRALARDWIFEEVWGCDAELGVKVLAVCVRRIRCKIEANPDEPRYLQTVRGFGYKLVSGEK